MNVPFADLSALQQARLFDLLEIHRYKFNKNQEILPTIKNENIIGIILDGFAQIINIEYNGNEIIKEELLKDSIFGPFISSLVGLIPNCGSSVMITELYLNNAVSFGSMLSGVLTGSGVAIFVLFIK